jgi:hypothetical protein
MDTPCAPPVSPLRLKASVCTTNRNVMVTMANTSERVRMAMAATGSPMTATPAPMIGRKRNGS